MSYNGSGTFQINSSGQPVVTGTVISSTAFNALTADLATGLSTAITKDGQTTTTARIGFAQGVSSTLTTDATSATTGSIITAGGISCQKALWVGTTTTLAGALTYGGVTLSNSVTGTGNMVLDTASTLSNPVVGTQSANDNSTKAASTAYTDAASPWRLLQTSTLSTSASAIFTAVASPYNDYMIVIRHLNVLTDNNNLVVELSKDGGSTWIADGNYDWFSVYGNSSGGTVGGFYNGAADNNFRVNGGNGAPTSSDGTYGLISSEMVIRDMLTVTDQGMSSNFQYKRQGVDYIYSGYTSGRYGNTTKSAKNGIRVKASSGNITGTITFYGRK